MACNSVGVVDAMIAVNPLRLSWEIPLHALAISKQLVREAKMLRIGVAWNIPEYDNP